MKCEPQNTFINYMGYEYPLKPIVFINTIAFVEERSLQQTDFVRILIINVLCVIFAEKCYFLSIDINKNCFALHFQM